MQNIQNVRKKGRKIEIFWWLGNGISPRHMNDEGSDPEQSKAAKPPTKMARLMGDTSSGKIEDGKVGKSEIYWRIRHQSPQYYFDE